MKCVADLCYEKPGLSYTVCLQYIDPVQLYTSSFFKIYEWKHLFIEPKHIIWVQTYTILKGLSMYGTNVPL